MSETPSIFEYVAESGSKPEVLETPNLYEHLGYTQITGELANPHEKDFCDYFSEQVVLRENESGRCIDNSLKDTKAPEVDVLQKNGEVFLGIKIGSGHRIIVKGEPTEVFAGIMQGYRSGLPVENILLHEKDQYLDLTAIAPRKNVPTLLSFSNRGSGFVGSTKYLLEENRELVVPATILLEIDYADKETPIEETFSKDFPYLFLHEASHAYLEEYDGQRDQDDELLTASKERDANAIALKTTHNFIREHPDSTFLSLADHKNWALKQLKDGYEVFNADNDSRADLRNKGLL